MKHFIVSLGILFFSLTGFAAKYDLDPSHSIVGFKVKHMGINWVNGRFNKFSGTFDFDEKTGKLKDLVAKIETASVDTQDPKRDEHLRGSDFFDVTKFAAMEFKQTKVELEGNKPKKVHGKLSLHGVTKDVILDVEYLGSTIDPWGKNRMGFEASTVINRKDFGMNWSKVMDKGGLVVGDEVRVTIEGEAIMVADAPHTKK